MTGILSLPSELLSAIIETCPEPERCRLRATCKVLNEHADPIVFRRLRLYLEDGSPDITENQVISLATRSSKACEFTKDLEIGLMSDGLQASEKSWPHFGHCDDLGVHLPTAISTLRNLTCFRWVIGHDPDWLINSLMQVVAFLPQLTELDIRARRGSNKTRIPLSQFANLSRLSVWHRGHEHVSFFISEMATVIANSPQLSSLNVHYTAPSNDDAPLLTLSALFTKIPTEDPLRLEHLSIAGIDTTIDQTTLPHLMHLKSFKFGVGVRDLSITRRVWTSFLENNIKLSDVTINGSITEETMSYLLSFSGLKTLVVDTMITEEFEKTLFEVVLPKHAKSLQTLRIYNTCLGKWVFNRTNPKSIMNCLKLRDLYVCINGKESGMTQLLLDTVAHLPELKILCFYSTEYSQTRKDLIENFKPSPGLRYVEELEMGWTRYALEKDGGRPVRYREIK